MRKTDRRDISARAALVARVTCEFREVPGLRITLPEARRLFDLREDICLRILDGLVVAGTLGRTSGDLYYYSGVMP